MIESNPAKHKARKIYLAFKYGKLYSPFLSISRQEESLTIIQNPLLWKNATDSMTTANIGPLNVHMSYPLDGNVHYTLEKKDLYSVHIYQDKTTIVYHSSSFEPSALNDLNALAVLSLPLKMFAKKYVPLESFSKDDYYSLPTTAFSVEAKNMTLSFSEKLLKQKYGSPIDITNMEGSLINVHIGIRSPLNKIEFKSPYQPIYQTTAFDDPLVEINITAHPNVAT
ncbi:MAG TPA: hypothetical protein VMV24_01200 [Candidatus Dormibacteraeota bacterium]|nr:hypothetical protein [Candidatus Dormibacteraeota bacterium]